MVGIDNLRELADSLFGDTDPGAILYVGQTQEILEDGDDLILQLPLPNVELDKVKLIKRGDELFVSIGNFKREMLLARCPRPSRRQRRTLFRRHAQVRFPENGSTAAA